MTDKTGKILRPGEYAHQNIDNYAIVDSDNVRGGRRVVSDKELLYSIPKDKLKEGVSIVRVERENADYMLVSIDSHTTESGWKKIEYGSSSSKVEVSGTQAIAVKDNVVSIKLQAPSGLKQDGSGLGVKINPNSSSYLSMDVNGVAFNSSAIDTQITNKVSNLSKVIGSKQDVLYEGDGISLESNTARVVVHNDEKYLKLDPNGLYTEMDSMFNRKADLIGGVVPASQLPSYIDEIRQVAHWSDQDPTTEVGSDYDELWYNTTKKLMYKWGTTISKEGDPEDAWVSAEILPTTIYINITSEPYTQWRYGGDGAGLVQINSDLSWVDGAGTKHAVNLGQQSISVQVKKNDPILLINENNEIATTSLLDIKNVYGESIWGNNIIIDSTGQKISVKAVAVTAGKGITIDNGVISTTTGKYGQIMSTGSLMLPIDYELYALTAQLSDLTISLPTTPISRLDVVKRCLVQIYNASENDITITFPTTEAGIRVHNMYHSTSMVIGPGLVGELDFTIWKNNISFNGGVELS